MSGPEDHILDFYEDQDTLSTIGTIDSLIIENDTISEAVLQVKLPRSERTVEDTVITTKNAFTLNEISQEKRDKLDSIFNSREANVRASSIALNSARTLKNQFNIQKTKIDNLEREFRRFEIAWYQKYTQAFACIVMFMIGAPLGAIIKKGGLGMPVLFSIIFFIIFYMLTITGEKWAKEGVTDPVFGTWFANLCLLPVGMFFLRQARKDARLFDADLYQSMFLKIKKYFKKDKGKN